MTPENFVYWLQGFLELSYQTSLDETQTKTIRDHLNLVFEKKTPTNSEVNNIPVSINPNNFYQIPLMCDTIQSGHAPKVDLSHVHIPFTC